MKPNKPEEQIREILDRVFYRGVDCGGVEYGGEGWSSDEEAEQILALISQTLKEWAEEVIEEDEEVSPDLNGYELYQRLCRNILRVEQRDRLAKKVREYEQK